MSETEGAARRPAPEYPRTLAALDELAEAEERAELDLTPYQFKVGDALIFEIGLPPEPGKNDGSITRLEDLAAQTKGRRREYSMGSLQHLRRIAAAFQDGDRDPSCSWTAHYAARSPEVLREAIRRNGGAPPTAGFVRQTRHEIRAADEEAERERQQAEHRRAEELSQEAEAERQRAAEAHNAEERAVAERRAERARRAADLARHQAEEAERAEAERKREKAEKKAAKIAEQLTDPDVAAAVAGHDSVGGRRVRSTVREQATENRHQQKPTKQKREKAESLPLPAFVPKMVGDIGAWGTGLRGVTDEDLAALSLEDPMVQTLVKVVDELDVEARRWLDALVGEGTRVPKLTVIDGEAHDVA